MQRSILLLKHLFTKPNKCVNLEVFPYKEKDWQSFVNLIHTNRLPLSNYHFMYCLRCKRKIPKNIYRQIRNYYFNTIIRNRKRKNLISKIKREASKKNIKIFFLKESDSIPNSDSPKFDIDVFTLEKNKQKMLSIFNSFGYNRIQNYSKESNCYKPQYKFASDNKYDYLPQIEYRYKLHTIPTYPVSIIDYNKLGKLTNDFAKVITNNFNLPSEYTFIFLCLVFFFEDQCKGLNNLYRIKQYYETNNKLHSWKKIDSLTKKYRIESVISFVVTLGFKMLSSQKKGVSSFWLRLALRGYDLRFVCRIAKNPYNGYTQWKDGYLCFLSRILLSDIHPLHKVILLFRPKRALYFFYYFLFAPEFVKL